MISCGDKSTKVDDDEASQRILSPLVIKSDSSPVFNLCSLSLNGSPKRAYFPTSPQEKASLLNEEEFEIIQSPRRKGEIDCDFIDATKSDSVTDVATLARSNSNLILVTLMSPSHGEKKQSFVFEIQSPQKLTADESFVSEISSPRKHSTEEKRSTQINIKYVAAIDEVSLDNNVLKSCVYGVKFKVKTKFYVSNGETEVNIGNYVLVEGDRGVDVGLVVSIHSRSEFRNSKNNENKDFHSIFRLANFLEYQHLFQKYYDEECALVHIQELVELYNLPLTIVDCEFQFDREKMIVYYKTPNQKRVDFRKLVTTLWINYRTRVWMERDKSEESDLTPITTSHLVSRPL